MTTETDPKPEVLVTPYEPAEPLPGVAPEYRRLEGGYVRGDAHPGAGEAVPEFDGELEDLREYECLMQQVAAIVLTPEARRSRDHDCWADIPDEVAHLKAEAERLDVALEMAELARDTFESAATKALDERDRAALVAFHFGMDDAELLANELRLQAATLEALADARETAGNTPPARNDAPDVAGEGPAPVEAQEGAQAVCRHGYPSASGGCVAEESGSVGSFCPQAWEGARRDGVQKSPKTAGGAGAALNTSEHHQQPAAKTEESDKRAAEVAEFATSVTAEDFKALAAIEQESAESVRRAQAIERELGLSEPRANTATVEAAFEFVLDVVVPVCGRCGNSAKVETPKAPRAVERMLKAPSGQVLVPDDWARVSGDKETRYLCAECAALAFSPHPVVDFSGLGEGSDE